ncbi:hypothetical protein FBR06_07680, partial [Betaproteobacteria bacterium PRO4]|nr:hypothetical protein [Betaproteobacteria bacterium PRO4]
MRCSTLFILALWILLPGSGLASDIALNLEEAERLALTRNRDIRFAQRNIEAAAADTLSAAASPNPILFLTTSH